MGTGCLPSDCFVLHRFDDESSRAACGRSRSSCGVWTPVFPMFVVARAFASAGVPVVKEPNGLARVDGERPDCLTLIPVNHWPGMSRSRSSTLAGEADELALGSSLEICWICQSVAITYFSTSSLRKFGLHKRVLLRFFISNLGHTIYSVSVEGRFLFQRLSVTFQRFNAILLNDTFSSDERDCRPFQRFSLEF